MSMSLNIYSQRDTTMVFFFQNHRLKLLIALAKVKTLGKLLCEAINVTQGRAILFSITWYSPFATISIDSASLFTQNPNFWIQCYHVTPITMF